jgi:hypothetical protein
MLGISYKTLSILYGMATAVMGGMGTAALYGADILPAFTFFGMAFISLAAAGFWAIKWLMSIAEKD